MEGLAHGEGPLPGRDNGTDAEHKAWLVAQKQKLRARQEGKDWDEYTAKALVTELRDVQTRMTLRKSESEQQEREVLGDGYVDQLQVETISASPTSYTSGKPPIYQAPRTGSAPTSPLGKRTAGGYHQETQTSQSWQSHQRPLQRQHSDTSYDRDRDQPVIPPATRPRAGSATKVSPPISPSERYYHNINQYAVPSTSKVSSLFSTVVFNVPNL